MMIIMMMMIIGDSYDNKRIIFRRRFWNQGEGRDSMFSKEVDYFNLFLTLSFQFNHY